jgi:fluoride exporter
VPVCGGLPHRFRAREPDLLPTHDRRELAAIFAGGIIGALARTGLTQAFPDSADSWPWAIFIVNVIGAFMLGYFVTRLQERLPTSAYKRPFLGTGLCGALTTFSTVQLELYNMVRADRWSLAIGYAAATLVTSFACVAAATAVVRRVRTVV